MSKKEFYEGKKAIKLSSVDVNKIVVSNKIKGNNETSKIFIGYIDDIDVIPLCLSLPQMSGWIKYFEYVGKNMSLKTEDQSVYVKYNSICIKYLYNNINKIKDLLSGIKLHSEPVYDDRYIKTKVKAFIEVIKTMFDGDKIPEERIKCTCLACIGINSVLKVGKKIIHRFI